VGATRRIRPALGLLLSTTLSAALAGGAAAWLAPRDEEIDLAPAPKVTAKAPTVGSLLAALTLDSRYAKNRLRLPAGHHRAGSTAPSGGRPAEPTRISIASAGAAGPVERMGVKSGQLQIPPPGRAGWFDAGPRPGEIGRAVIVSHVDSKQGPALFFNLLQQQRGSRIVVRDRRGGEHRFAVVRRRQIEKSHFPAASVYGASARPMLVLITCGGPFSPDTGYRDNVILYARAV
jgi:hypothetical protein